MTISAIVLAITGMLTSLQIGNVVGSAKKVLSLVPEKQIHLETSIPTFELPTPKQTTTPSPMIFKYFPSSTPISSPISYSPQPSAGTILPLYNPNKHTPNPTPLTTSDTQPPVFEFIGGPQDGSTINFNSFCFPMKLVDNSGGQIWVRYSFDNSGPSEWTQNYAPCYNSIEDGFHFFIVQGKDESNNITNFVSRNFTVNSDSSEIQR